MRRGFRVQVVGWAMLPVVLALTVAATVAGPVAWAADGPQITLSHTGFRQVFGKSFGKVSGGRTAMPCRSMDVNRDEMENCASAESWVTVGRVLATARVVAVAPAGSVTKTVRAYARMAGTNQTRFGDGYVEYNYEVESNHRIPFGRLIVGRTVEGAKVPDEMAPFALAIVMDGRLARQGVFVVGDCRVPEDYITSFPDDTSQVLAKCAKAVAVAQAVAIRGRVPMLRAAGAPWLHPAP